MAIGPFIADFCCFEHRLVVELDGEPHDDLDAKARDAARTAFLKREGYRVLRFPNERVLGNLEFVLREIASVLDLAGLPSSDPASPGHLLPVHIGCFRHAHESANLGQARDWWEKGSRS